MIENLLFVGFWICMIIVCICLFMIYRTCYVSNVITNLIDSIDYYNRRQILMGRKDRIPYDVIIDSNKAVNKIYFWKPSDFVPLSVWLKIENDYNNLIIW